MANQPKFVLVLVTSVALLSLGCDTDKKTKDDRYGSAGSVAGSANVAGAAAAAGGALGSASHAGAGASAAAAAAAAGTTAPSGPPCPLEVFAQTVWAPTLTQICLNCHITNGLAQSQGSKFILLDQAQPNYLPANLTAFMNESKILANGVPMVLAKPSAQVSHGGGQIFTPTSTAYQAFNHFLTRTDMTGTCSTITSATTSNLLLSSDAQVLRKAALFLGGRLPTTAESTMTGTGGLTQALDTVLSGPYFASFIKRVYNDQLLTDFYRNDNLIDFLYQTYNLANSTWRANTGIYDLYMSVHAAWSEYENPTELISFVITNDHPYTEILTGNYLMMTPYSACDILGAGHSLKFANTCTNDAAPANTCKASDMSFGILAQGNVIDDCWEFQPGVPTWSGGPPVVGVLSDVTVLTRFDTTPSNLNRHRANMIYSNFLGLNIGALGAVLPPGTSAAASAITNPTMNAVACAACHILVDPVASSLQNFGEQGQYQTGAWSQAGMFPPGYNGVPMPSTVTTDPLVWLSQQIIKDPRFARTAVAFWYTAITGNQPLADPPAADPNLGPDLAAKLAQNAFFDQLAQQFAANNFNTRQMIKQLLMSPYYRAYGYQAGTSTKDQLLLAGFDHAHRQGPEEMNQTFIATTGAAWEPPGNPPQNPNYDTYWNWGQTYLMDQSSFEITDGGIDSKQTLNRNNGTSPVASAVASFAASSMPCSIAAADFALPAASRQFFPKVSLTSVPDNGTGTAAIKQNLAFLHQLFLGETLAVTDPELLDTYNLFVTLYNNHQSTADTSLDSTCQSGSITSDSTYTLHAWMGVMSYLMNDFDFLYE